MKFDLYADDDRNN